LKTTSKSKSLFPTFSHLFPLEQGNGMAHPLRPKWQLDSKGRTVINKIVREELHLEKGAWGYMEVYGSPEAGKILLTVMDHGQTPKQRREQT